MKDLIPGPVRPSFAIRIESRIGRRRNDPASDGVALRELWVSGGGGSASKSPKLSGE